MSYLKEALIQKQAFMPQSLTVPGSAAEVKAAEEATKAPKYFWSKAWKGLTKHPKAKAALIGTGLIAGPTIGGVALGSALSDDGGQTPVVNYGKHEQTPAVVADNKRKQQTAGVIPPEYGTELVAGLGGGAAGAGAGYALAPTLGIDRTTGAIGGGALGAVLAAIAANRLKKA